MSAPLPNTGAPSIVVGVVGAVMIAVGGFLLKFARMGAKSATKDS
jgi:LPXTG-motif cell wall-anchored protein